MKIVKINTKNYQDLYAFQSNKSDKPFLNLMTVCKSIPLYTTDIVADIGAYIGEFGIYCTEQGVKEVHCYEPTPNTFKVLSKNQRGSMILHNAAVVGDNQKFVDLYISKGIGVTNSIAKTNKNKKISVPAINYNEAIKNATVVKIDVEGAEYSYDIIQNHIRAYIIEFHPLVDIDWISNAKKIMQQLHQSGYKTIHRPGFKNGWDLIGSFLKK
jgi:FkbM family methyltransferase